MKSLRIAILLAFLVVVLTTRGVWAIASGLPSHDAYVDVNAPTENFDDNELEVDASGSLCEPTMIVYMQWDLSSIADTVTISTATLTLTTVLPPQNTSGVSLTLYETSDGWNEATLTKNNAPAVGAAIETRPAPTANGETVVFNSSALRSYIAAQALGSGDNKASFALQFSGACTAGLTVAVFADRENLSVGGPNLQLRGPNAVKRSTFNSFGLAAQGPIVGLLVLGVLGGLVWRRRVVRKGGVA
ncbi:MAG TPA: DNRLRE domain-containing protein [Anaerolineae bacterium]|nr:DNRLRE domain-containing protein [Anaerolineae bacterium]HQI83622.1 DNRLRE domain-containing protein [Anaerolineae bacterium]